MRTLCQPRPRGSARYLCPSLCHSEDPILWSYFKEPEATLHARVCQISLRFPSALGGSSPPAHPVRSKSGCSSGKLRKVSRRAWPRCSSRTWVSVREPAAPGARGAALAPKAKEVQAPVSALHPSHPPEQMPNKSQRCPGNWTRSSWIYGQHIPRAYGPVRTLDSGTGPSRAAEGKEAGPQGPGGSGLRSSGTRPAGSQASGD